MNFTDFSVNFLILCLCFFPLSFCFLLIQLDHGRWRQNRMMKRCGPVDTIRGKVGGWWKSGSERLPKEGIWSTREDVNDVNRWKLTGKFTNIYNIVALGEYHCSKHEQGGSISLCESRMGTPWKGGNGSAGRPPSNTVPWSCYMGLIGYSHVITFRLDIMTYYLSIYTYIYTYE